jgi:hypothetical protein
MDARSLFSINFGNYRASVTKGGTDMEGESSMAADTHPDSG